MSFNLTVGYAIIYGVPLYSFVFLVRYFRSHNFRAEAVIEIARTELDMMCRSGIVVKVYLIVPVGDPGTIIGRISVDEKNVLIVRILIMGVSVDIHIIIVEGHSCIAKQSIVENIIPSC